MRLRHTRTGLGMTQLQEQVKAALEVVSNETKKRNRAKHVTWYPFPMERDIIIIWGMYRGWRNTAIANKLGLSARTVRRLRYEFGRNPVLIFNLPVLYKGYKWNKPFYRCEFCGEMMVKVGEEEAREHVARHIAAREVISMSGVGEDING